MDDPLLLLRLEAPLQSWGTRARWDVRDSGPEPTKSGVIGLLGCALGLPRRHPRLETLDGELTFGVRIDRPGMLATDYHTVTGRHRMANGKLKPDEYTVQSYRDYLHDAAFLVALAGRAELLEELAGALRNPRWPLFLGRKSCVPTRPVLEAVTGEYAGLEDALQRAPWSAPTDRHARREIARTFAPEVLPAALREWPGAETWVPVGPAYALTAWVEYRPREEPPPVDPRDVMERQDSLRVNDLRFYEFRRARHVRVPLKEALDTGLEVLSS